MFYKKMFFCFKKSHLIQCAACHFFVIVCEVNKLFLSISNFFLFVNSVQFTWNKERFRISFDVLVNPELHVFCSCDSLIFGLFRVFNWIHQFSCNCSQYDRNWRSEPNTSADLHTVLPRSPSAGPSLRLVEV